MKNISSIIDKIQNVNLEKPVLVFGDYCLDKYIYSYPNHDEVSIETNLPAFQIEHVKNYAGAAGTICNNLRSLGIPVLCAGAIGNDGIGYDLQNCLNSISADFSPLIIDNLISTNSYQKLMRWNGNTFEESTRYDFKNVSGLSEKLEEKIIDNLERYVPQASAVIILDQYEDENAGILNRRIKNKLNSLAKQYLDIIFYVDSRAYGNDYQNMLMKCNMDEFLKLNGLTDNRISRNDFLLMMTEFEQRTNNHLLVTWSEKGVFFIKDFELVNVPSFRVEGPIDIVGAGDATTSGIMLGLLSGLSLENAALVGCAVSSITIQQMGTTGIATIEQVKERLSEKL